MKKSQFILIAVLIAALTLGSVPVSAATTEEIEKLWADTKVSSAMKDDAAFFAGIEAYFAGAEKTYASKFEGKSFKGKSEKNTAVKRIQKASEEMEEVRENMYELVKDGAGTQNKVEDVYLAYCEIADNMVYIYAHTSAIVSGGEHTAMSQEMIDSCWKEIQKQVKALGKRGQALGLPLGACLDHRFQ